MCLIKQALHSLFKLTNMFKVSNLTENDIGFFVVSPPSSDITDGLLENSTTAKQEETAHIFISDWLVYEPDGEEDGISWQIPGIKLYFKNESDFDKAKSIADQIVAELKDKTQLKLDLVFIDKTRLLNA